MTKRQKEGKGNTDRHGDGQSRRVLQPEVGDKEFATRSIHAGIRRTAEREHNEALFITSSYVFPDAEAAAGTFRGEEDGNVYSRFTNPTVKAFEQRLASLEGASHAIGTSSGMGAITLLGLSFLNQGDSVILGRNLFGSTLTLFKKIFSRFGIQLKIVDFGDLANLERAIDPTVKFVFIETPSNPLCDVVDIKATADMCHRHNILLVVDNCFCTPALMQPMKLGADVVIHSATKYLDGQGRCIGGAVVVNSQQQFDELLAVQRSAGLSMSPFNAWVFNHGLETLSLRMQRHCENAQSVAEFLENHPKVECVYYAGLKTHQGHDIAARQQRGFGGVLSFEVKGGENEAWQLIDNTHWLSITGNLGDAKTTITHPASTTHGKLSEEDRSAMGIKSNLIRLSVGLEDAQDIIADMSEGLNSI